MLDVLFCLKNKIPTVSSMTSNRSNMDIVNIFDFLCKTYVLNSGSGENRRETV